MPGPSLNFGFNLLEERFQAFLPEHFTAKPHEPLKHNIPIYPN